MIRRDWIHQWITSRPYIQIELWKKKLNSDPQPAATSLGSPMIIYSNAVTQIYSHLSSRSCIVLAFILISMIHFELFFYMELGRIPTFFFFLHVDTQLSQQHCWKHYFFLLNCLCTLVKHQLTVLVRVIGFFFLNSRSLPLIICLTLFWYHTCLMTWLKFTS